MAKGELRRSARIQKTTIFGKNPLDLTIIRFDEAVSDGPVARTILMTGAGSNSGRPVAEALVDEGHRVFAAMRDPFGKDRDAANRLWARGIDVVQLDVTHDASVRAAVNLVTRKAGRIDVLLNNARQSTFGPIAVSPSEQIEHAFNVSVVGVVRTSQAVLPAMEGGGLIVNFGSVLGRTALPLFGLRCSVGAALEALTDAMRLELRAAGIDVSLILRGAIETMPELIAARRLSDSGEQPNSGKTCQAVIALIGLPFGSRPARMFVGDASNVDLAVDVSERVRHEVVRSIPAEPMAELCEKFGMPQPV